MKPCLKCKNANSLIPNDMDFHWGCRPKGYDPAIDSAHSTPDVEGACIHCRKLPDVMDKSGEGRVTMVFSRNREVQVLTTVCETCARAAPVAQYMVKRTKDGLVFDGFTALSAFAVDNEMVEARSKNLQGQYLDEQGNVLEDAAQPR